MKDLCVFKNRGVNSLKERNETKATKEKCPPAKEWRFICKDWKRRLIPFWKSDLFPNALILNARRQITFNTSLKLSVTIN